MKKTLLLISLCLFNYIAKAQDASVEKSIFGIQTGILGAWIHHEAKLTNKIALRTEIGADVGLYGRNNSTDYILGTVLTLEPRWYYNISKRSTKKKRIDGNSGNFISLKTSYHPDLILASNNKNITLVSDLTIVPTWGIRRPIGKHFNYEAGIGVGYIHYFKKENVIILNEADVAVNLHLRIGYRF
ncbi:MAG: hypothetical protein ACPG6B_03165 [Oceanihabitans sp.]